MAVIILNGDEFEVLRPISLVKGGLSLSDISSKFSSYDHSSTDLKALLEDMHARGVVEVHCIEDEEGNMSSLYRLNSNKFKTGVISEVLNELKNIL